jgi:hypothetical protein
MRVEHAFRVSSGSRGITKSTSGIVFQFRPFIILIAIFNVLFV